MTQPTRSVVEALSAKLVDFPQIENLRVVLEKCDSVDDTDDKLNTSYVQCPACRGLPLARILEYCAGAMLG